MGMPGGAQRKDRRPWAAAVAGLAGALAATSAVVLATPQPVREPAPEQRVVTAALPRAAGPAVALEQVASRAPAPNRRHPFSNPVWSPVRESSKITCVRTNCTGRDGRPFHGYWAIEFIGRRGAPVYAAGAGVFHIGARQASCSTTPGKMAEGTWAWVDHGGGLVSRYHHLDRITAKEGQLVTPATRIGTMGHWGDMLPCTTDYLHYEVRYGGVKGTRIDPKALRACTPSGPVIMPHIFGTTSFDRLQRGRSWTPAASSSCVTSLWNHTPAAPRLTAVPRSSGARLAWGKPPSGTTAIRVSYEVWSPSQHRYGMPRYTTFSKKRTGGTLGPLSNGRTYRVKIAFRNAYGFSAWSTARIVVPHR